MTPTWRTWLARRLRVFGRDERGFTLLEVVVSATLFVIAAAAAGAAIVGNTKSSHLSQERVRAANLAQSMLAGIRPGQPVPTTLPTASTDGYGLRISMSPATETCPKGTTRAVTVLVFAPNAAADAAPVARTDSLVSC
jgi:prepilin-type N-terminal cleavage/methylation domain-containing protein